MNTLLASPYRCGHRLAREPLPPVSPRALITGGIVHCACLDEFNYCCLNILVTELPLVFSKKEVATCTPANRRYHSGCTVAFVSVVHVTSTFGRKTVDEPSRMKVTVDSNHQGGCQSISVKHTHDALINYLIGRSIYVHATDVSCDVSCKNKPHELCNLIFALYCNTFLAPAPFTKENYDKSSKSGDKLNQVCTTWKGSKIDSRIRHEQKQKHLVLSSKERVKLFGISMRGYANKNLTRRCIEYNALLENIKPTQCSSFNSIYWFPFLFVQKILQLISQV